MTVLQRKCSPLSLKPVNRFAKPTFHQKQQRTGQDRSQEIAAFLLMRRRYQYKSKLKKNQSSYQTDRAQEALIEIEEKLLKSHDDQRKREEHLAVQNIKENSKFFFTYANKK